MSKSNRMTEICFQCGCRNTIAYQDVKDKVSTPWRHLDSVKITVSLMLHYCENCGNTPIYAEDAKRIDDAVERSLVKKYLNNMFLFKEKGLYVGRNSLGSCLTNNILEAKLFSYEEYTELDYNTTETRKNYPNVSAIPLYSELSNNNISKTVFEDIARHAMNMQIEERR